MEDEPTPRRPPRRVLYLLLVPIVVLTVTNYLGDAVAPKLVTSHPVWLLLLNSRKRYLALTATSVDPVTFYIVGVGRQLLSDPLYFLIGRWYGDGGVRWLERKLGDGAAVVTLTEKWFKKAAYPMVFLAPNPLICMLAGAARMRVKVFFLVNLGGTIVTIAILRLFGDVFSSPINNLLHFIRRYQWQLTAVSVALVAFQLLQNRRKGTGDIESVTKMERELDEAAGDDPRLE